MIVNVHVIASVHSDRPYRPVELIKLLEAAHTGTETAFDVVNTMLVSEFITTITTQLDMNSLPIHEPYRIIKNDVILDSTKTLAQNGVIANDTVHLRVTLYLA